MLTGGEKTQVFALFFTTILAWASFLSIIFFTNPQGAGIFGVYVIYASAVLGLTGLLTILWKIIKLKKKN